MTSDGNLTVGGTSTFNDIATFSKAVTFNGDVKINSSLETNSLTTGDITSSESVEIKNIANFTNDGITLSKNITTTGSLSVNNGKFDLSRNVFVITDDIGTRFKITGGDGYEDTTLELGYAVGETIKTKKFNAKTGDDNELMTRKQIKTLIDNLLSSYALKSDVYEVDQSGIPTTQVKFSYRGHNHNDLYVTSDTYKEHTHSVTGSFSGNATVDGKTGSASGSITGTANKVGS